MKEWKLAQSQELLSKIGCWGKARKRAGSLKYVESSGLSEE